MLMPFSEGPESLAKKRAEWPESMPAVLNPKFLILALALLGAGCMTDDGETDLLSLAAVPVPVTAAFWLSRNTAVVFDQR